MTITSSARTIYPPTPEEAADFDALGVLVEMLTVFDDQLPGASRFVYDGGDDDRRLPTFEMTKGLANLKMPFEQRGLARAVRTSGVRPRSLRFKRHGVLKGYSAKDVCEGIERLFIRWTGELSSFNLTANPYRLTEGIGVLADAIKERFALYTAAGRPIPGAREWYMVRDEIWTEAGLGKGILCIGCLEKRLGRELGPGDFDDTAANAPSRLDTPRLLARKGINPEAVRGMLRYLGHLEDEDQAATTRKKP
jgi:hypothetical protein